jgi:N utilization substance protein A
MNTKELISSFEQFKEFKSIDKVTLMGILESIFRTLILKRYGTDENIEVVINPEKGDLQIWRNRKVVPDDDLYDETLEIILSEAQEIDPDFQVGEEVAEEIKIDDFGRRNILSVRQQLLAKIMELDKDNLYKKYKQRVGEVISGDVYQVFKKELIIHDEDGNELVLPRNEQIPSDFFKKGDTLRALVYKVESMNNGPKVVLSRIAPEFLAKLMEKEVPEIFDGLITIKRIVREAGQRAKVAVESYDDRIDPVGSCVGVRGSRLNGVVRELRGENIDVISFTQNLPLLIQRALSPAKISSVSVNEEKSHADVYLKSDQVSLAIGKQGVNIKLAGRICNVEIDLYREEDESSKRKKSSVSLDVFQGSMEDWVLQELKKLGCDSLQDVLEFSVEELVRRTDLEEETVKELLADVQEYLDNEADA